jgi:hypothetical protein
MPESVAALALAFSSLPTCQNSFLEETMAKYGSMAAEKVEKAMHERRKGTLKSGRPERKSRVGSKRSLLDFHRLGRRAARYRLRRPPQNNSTHLYAASPFWRSDWKRIVNL